MKEGISAQGLEFGYGSRRILHDISVELGYGRLICIIGPNGVGKSTFVKCLNRILEPDTGSVTVDDMDLDEMRLGDIAKKIGFVPVGGDGSFRMNVLETVLLGRFPHAKPGSRNHDVGVAYDALKKVGMEGMAMCDASQLSAGQKQMVAIAKGLAQQPKLLILDEPTANLDPRHQIRVTKLLRDISHEEGVSVLMISHDLNVAAKYADEIIVMGPPGIVYSSGNPVDVITEPMIRDVYGVDCKVIDDCGRPHVILGDEI